MARHLSAMKRLFLGALFFYPLALAAAPAIELDVDFKKKTTKTSEAGGTSSKTMHYVDRSVLQVSMSSVAGSLETDVACYFVARNVQTHALKYHGFEKRAVVAAREKKMMQVESQPVASTQRKVRDSTADAKRGDVAVGWVVIVSAGGQEIAARASAQEVLQWVRKNPPRQRTQTSP